MRASPSEPGDRPHAAWLSDSGHNRNLSGLFSVLLVGACCALGSVLGAGDALWTRHSGLGG